MSTVYCKPDLRLSLSNYKIIIAYAEYLRDYELQCV